MPRRSFLCLLLLAALSAGLVLAAQPQFWSIEGARDFLEGDTDGLSIDSEGRVRLAPASKPLYDPAVPYVWCLTRDARGVLYAGSGNDGKVFRIEGGKGSLVFDAAEMEVHALVAGPDGKLYAGSSPDGKVYAIDASGTGTTFFDPGDKYIWALAFDGSGNLYVATGSDGKVYKVDRQGKAKTVLTGAETHVTALAIDRSGNVYAGSSPGGIIYRVDPAGKVFVLHDSNYREIKSLDVAADGSLFAAVIDGKREETPRSIEPLLIPPTVSSGGEVTVSESITVIGTAPPAPAPTPTPRGPEPMRGGGSKGGLLRLSPSGEVDTLWTSTEEMPFSVLATSDGILVGAGSKGQVYRVQNDRTWTMVTSFPAEQVTALSRRSDGGVDLATSNPGLLHTIEAGLGGRGTFTSKVKDTEAASSWGRIRWEGTMPAGTEIQIQTRSGNTGSPDSTWTDWSAAYVHREGDPVSSEHARYLQVRAVLAGKGGTSPVLDSISTAYLQRNLRPQVQTITVHPPGEVFQKPLSLTGEMEILGLDQGPSTDGRPGAPGAPRPPSPPPAISYSRKLYQKGIQTFSWKADDPNGDTLVYDVWYRPLEETRFRLLRKGLTDAVLAWDTTTVPNGRYVIRVTASDAAANPEALALASDKESSPFDIDNTPPSVTVTLVSTRPVKIRAVVRDDSSIVRKAEYSIDGGRWKEVHPVDGISDAREETYDVPTSDLGTPGPHVVVVRGTDLLGNVATARVEVP